LGLRGERRAARLLKGLGYIIVARGVRLRGGELDLVAIDGRTIVFVEVKTRRKLRGGDAIGTCITFDKQRRITMAAYEFLKRHRLLGYAWRFDVITVLWPRGQRPLLQHDVGAFEAAYGEGSLY
jgi:putative endonuclease